MRVVTAALGVVLAVSVVLVQADPADARPLTTQAVFYGDASNVFIPGTDPVAQAEAAARFNEQQYELRTGSSCVEVPVLGGWCPRTILRTEGPASI